MNIREDKKILLPMGVCLSVIVLTAIIRTFRTTSGAQVFLSLGLIVAGLLMFAILLHTATKPETELVDLYYVAMVVGTISWSVLRWHHRRKGDVV